MCFSNSSNLSVLCLASPRDYRVEIGLLKRDLLDFAGVRSEFANEALFCNLCEPLKLFNLAGVAIHFVTFDFCCDSERIPYGGLDGARPRWNLRGLQRRIRQGRLKVGNLHVFTGCFLYL